MVREGRIESAVQLGEKSLQQHPAALDVRGLLGHLYLRLGDAAKAEQQFSALLEARPGDARTRALLGGLALARGDRAGARRQLAALEAQGAQALAALLRGDIASTEGEAAAAFEAYRAAWSRAPSQKTLLKMLEAARAAKAPFPREAVESWLASHPGDRPVRHRLALVELGQGHPEAARALARKALEVAPGQVILKDTLGWIEAKAGRPEAGLALLDEVLAVYPENPEVLLHKAWVLDRLGREAQAGRVLRRALAVMPAGGVPPEFAELAEKYR